LQTFCAGEGLLLHCLFHIVTVQGLELNTLSFTVSPQDAVTQV